MTDGKIFYVPHADFIGLHATGQSVVFYGNNRRHILNLKTIIEISYTEDNSFES